MATEIRAGLVSDIPPGSVVGAGRWAVGNVNGEFFALSRRCRHLFADLAGGKIDRNGCLVCPWHASAYDAFYIALTKALPLARGTVEVRDGVVYVR